MKPESENDDDKETRDALGMNDFSPDEVRLSPSRTSLVLSFDLLRQSEVAGLCWSQVAQYDPLLLLNENVFQILRPGEMT